MHFRKNTLKTKSYSGGAEEDRTPDPLRAKQVLSQLSYGPLAAAFFLIRRYFLLSSVTYLLVRALLV